MIKTGIGSLVKPPVRSGLATAKPPDVSGPF
jgi:hypothetical protein